METRPLQARIKAHNKRRRQLRRDRVRTALEKLEDRKKTDRTAKAAKLQQLNAVQPKLARLRTLIAPTKSKGKSKPALVGMPVAAPAVAPVAVPAAVPIVDDSLTEDEYEASPVASPVGALTVVVPAGIGDFSWIYSKLMTLGIPLRVRGTAAGPPRLVPFLRMFPNVTPLPSVKMSFTTLKRKSIPPHTPKSVLLTASGEVHLEPNTWLESGNRLEDWLPELDTNLHYPLIIAEEAIAEADAVLPDCPFVCLFAGNEGTARNWQCWHENEWVEFMVGFRQRIADMPFVLVGAAWDVSMATKIVQRAKQEQLSIYNLVSTLALPVSLQVIVRSEYFIAFPSGLGILANVMHQPATMFYPGQSLLRMPGTWCDPATVASHEFRELPFPAPEAMVEWLDNVYDFNSRYLAAHDSCNKEVATP